MVQIVHLSRHALFAMELLNVFKAWHENVTKQSGKSVMTSGLKTVEYRCSICHKSCRTARGLVLNEGLHRGVYPYTCPLRDLGFSGNSNLIIHLVVHTGVNEFTCNICKRAFRYEKGTTKCATLSVSYMCMMALE